MRRRVVQPGRASYFVATYLLSSSTDYTVWFVNPRATRSSAGRCTRRLAALPAAPDLVDVFRRAEELPAVADEAVAVGRPHLLGSSSGSERRGGARIAHGAGLAVVMNRCLKIEHARFAGGLHLAGFDTGVLSSSKRMRCRSPVHCAQQQPAPSSVGVRA